MSKTARRILVVDDEPLVCDSIKLILTGDGHTVEVAGTGQTALHLFHTSRFDLTIVDYDMPGMKGDQLAAAIKSLDPKHPVILITAYPEMIAATGNLLGGVDVALGKPFDFEQFRSAVNKLLANR